MLSGLEAFLTFSLHKTFWTPMILITRGRILGNEGPSSLGTWLLGFLGVKTDLNCWFKRVAFILALMCKAPPSLVRAIPTLSCFRNVIYRQKGFESCSFRPLEEDFVKIIPVRSTNYTQGFFFGIFIFEPILALMGMLCFAKVFCFLLHIQWIAWEIQGRCLVI